MSSEVTYVFLGSRLPSYTGAALEMARRTSGLDVRLVASQEAIRAFGKRRVNSTSIEDFYDSSEFESARSAVTYPHDFRDGFWLKTLERLFVLEQFWRAESSEDVFHAELDQLLFRCDLLLGRLRDNTQPAVFFPFHTSELGVASVFYSNSREALRSIIDFALSVGSFASEMQLLGRWATANPRSVVALPTLADFLLHDQRDFAQGFRALAPGVDGFVDGMQVGQWVTGIDPRNVAIEDKPANKWVDVSVYDPQLLSGALLGEMSLSMREESGDLFCRVGDGEWRRLYNLHVHSKIHPYLLDKDPKLVKLIEQTNRPTPVSFPGTRLVQVKYHLALQIHSGNRVLWRIQRLLIALIPLKFRLPLRPIVNALRSLRAGIKRVARPRFLLRKLYVFFSARPSSHPFLSGDTFRLLADYVVEPGGRRDNPANIPDQSIVFCETSELERFLERMRRDRPSGVTLIAGNCDRGFEEHMVASCRAVGVEWIFAQNLISRVSGVHPLPLGLENKWRLQNGHPGDFARARREVGDKLFRVAWSFDVDTNPALRKPAREALETSAVADNIGVVSPSAHRKCLVKYAFVASPPGNGVDTHRSWEALYLKCVPILMESESSKFFKEMGLPVLLVQDYSEVSDFTEQKLKGIYEDLSAGFESELLWMPYWVDLIKKHSE